MVYRRSAWSGAEALGGSLKTVVGHRPELLRCWISCRHRETRRQWRQLDSDLWPSSGTGEEVDHDHDLDLWPSSEIRFPRSNGATSDQRQQQRRNCRYTRTGECGQPVVSPWSLYGQSLYTRTGECGQPVVSTWSLTDEDDDDESMKLVFAHSYSLKTVTSVITRWLV